jgi:hypothetical protein
LTSSLTWTTTWTWRVAITPADGDRYRLQLSEAFDVVITNHLWVEPGDPQPDDGGCGCGAAAGGGARQLRAGCWLCSRSSR